MSDLLLALLGGVVSTGGAWYWVKSHSHPELVHRNELELLRTLLESQHSAVLRELEHLRDSLDRGRSNR